MSDELARSARAIRDALDRAARGLRLTGGMLVVGDDRGRLIALDLAAGVVRTDLRLRA